MCGTDNLSHILEREIETDTIRQLLSLGGGTASLNEILLPESFIYAGKAIMDIPIPGDTILVSITRDTEFIIPHGSTVLLPWDHILCLTRDDSLLGEDGGADGVQLIGLVVEHLKMGIRDAADDLLPLEEALGDLRGHEVEGIL